MSQVEQVPHTVVWFEIPVANIDRAAKFYERVFATQLRRMEMFGQLMAMFNTGHAASVNGALVQAEGYVPTNSAGAVVYLNGGSDLAPTLAKVPDAGGKVLIPKTALPPGMGFFAQFEDSEGNRVGLFSQA
jgi:hypothetical protein